MIQVVAPVDSNATMGSEPSGGLDGQIVDLSPDHVSVVGPDYRYRRVNQAYEAAHDLGRERIVGCTVAELLGQHVFEERVQPLLDKCLAGEDVRYEAWFDFPGTGHRFMGVTYTPLTGGDGRTEGVLVVSRDLTERKQVEQEVQLAREQAEAANRTRAAFLATMSHELRTPLNAIIGFAEVIQTEVFGPLTNPHYASYVDDIKQSGTYLLALVQDVLDLSALETGDLELTEQAVDPAGLVEACLRMVRLKAVKGRIRLTTDLPLDLPQLRGDARRLKKMLFALVANAVNFTPEGGRVGIAVEEDSAGGLLFRIQDTGIGMTEEEAKAALYPFGVAHDPMVRGREGAGMGLPLAHNLAAAHGATLEIRSVPDEGTLVLVRMPPARVVP